MTDSAEHQPLSPDGRKIPPSMVVVAIALFTGFAALGILTVLSVTGETLPPPPEIEALPMPSGVDIVDSHATCQAEACDGTGYVIAWDPMTSQAAVSMLTEHFLGSGWVDAVGTCDEGSRCLSQGDLRAEIRPWSMVDETVGTIMRTSLRERGIDEVDLVYVSVASCSILGNCGGA